MRYIVLAASAALLLPLGAHAAGPSYTSFVETGAGDFVLKLQTIGKESRLYCTAASATCTAVADDFELPRAGSVSNPWPSLPAGAAWRTRSPDGRYVAYYIPATQTRATRTFGILDTQTGKTYTNTEKNIVYWDLLSEGIKLFAFSPDSTRLIYMSDKQGPSTLYMVNVAQLPQKGFTSTRLFGKGYTVSDFGWIDQDTIYYTANRAHPLTWSLYRYDLDADTPEKITDHVSYASTIRRFGDWLVFIKIDGNTALPWRYDTAARESLAFTVPGMSPAPAPVAELVQTGGLTGALWKAPRATTTLAVWLHGGPYRQTSAGYHPYFSYAGYDWMLAELQQAGVSVLKLDYPGSFGYGRAFAESLRLKVGSKDVKDTAAAIQQFAKARGYKNIYLVGNSYGGYLAPRLLVEQPSLYKGVFALNGVWDWSMLTDKLQTSIFNVHFGGVEGESNGRLYATSSILDRLRHITTQKVVLAHGQSDMTIPFTQSQTAYDILRLGGKEATLLAYPGEDHVFKQKETFVSLCQELLRFAGASAAGRCTL